MVDASRAPLRRERAAAMSLAAAIREMLANGFTLEQALRAAEICEANMASKRKPQTIRVRKPSNVVRFPRRP